MVAKQPVIIPSALFCVVCSFVIFAFERMDVLAGKVYFTVK